MPRLRRIAAYVVTTAFLTASIAACGGAQARAARHLQKGHEYLAEENFKKARVEFLNALQLAPKDPEARLAVGLVDEKLGNIREAAQYYQGVLDVSPANPQARAHLAKFFLFGGNAERAEEMLEEGFKTHPDDPGLLTVRAAAHVSDKNYDAARADAERSLALAPTNEDTIQVLAGIYMNQEHPDLAIALLERSVQKVQGANLRLVLAQLYLQLGRKDEAEAQLLKIVQIEPKVLARRLVLAQFYSKSGNSDAAERTLRQAVKDLPEERSAKLSLIDFLSAQRGREVAEHELVAMVTAAPDDAELRFALAKFYVVGGQRDKAEAVYTQMIDTHKLEPSGLQARDQLAALRLQVNDADRALALANEVLAKSPRDDDALSIRGTIALSRQEPRSAIADLRAVLRDQPNAIGVVRTLARAHLANGEPALAEETLRHAVESNASNSELSLEYAQLLSQLGKNDQAATVLKELIKQKPDNVDALTEQFRVALRAKDLPTAKSAADAVVALRPALPLGYIFQGMVAEVEKRPDDAQRLYSHAVDVKPDVEESLSAYVRVMATNGHVLEALKRLDELTAKYPEASLALDFKGELLLEKGRVEEAESAFKQAIARTPKWWKPYRDLATAQATQKSPAAAIATLKNAETAVDQPVLLAEQLAALSESTGKPEDAIATYDELIKQYPQSEILANNLAMLLATYRHDAPSLERARVLASRFAHSPNLNYLDTYGWTLLKQGDAESALPIFTQVVAKAPDALIPRYHLGMAQSLSGKNEDARSNLTRALSSGRRFSGFEEAKATLDRLSKNTASDAPKT